MSLSKDLEEKRLIYAKAGIIEYWVIEVEKKQLRVFKGLSKEDYQQEQIYTKGEISSLAFPEIQLLIENLV